MSNLLKNSAGSRQTIEVTILGQRMALKADEDPRHLERLASYINRKADEVSGGAPIATTKLAVLAALNIANDYFRALDDTREFKRQVADKSRVLLAELERTESRSGNHGLGSNG